MIYRHWMSSLSDDAHLVQVVLPGAHNAGTYGMPPLACCQDADLYAQIVSGVRHFCLRLDTTRKGIVISHGLTECRYHIQRNDHFVRIEVRDSAGRKAWSSPVRIG